jgi:hypothetical protein
VVIGKGSGKGSDRGSDGGCDKARERQRRKDADKKTSIMITRLQKIHPIIPHHVHQSVFLGDASRPDAGGEVFEGFGFADALEGLAHDGLDQFQAKQGLVSETKNTFSNSIWLFVGLLHASRKTRRAAPCKKNLLPHCVIHNAML